VSTGELARRVAEILEEGKVEVSRADRERDVITRARVLIRRRLDAPDGDLARELDALGLSVALLDAIGT